MKLVLIYLLFVGLPVSGVIGVLHAGRDIAPPPHVGGSWAIVIRPDSVCRPPVTSDTSSMVVSQSGPHIRVTFSDTTFPDLEGRAYGPHFRVTNHTDLIRLHAAKLKGQNRIRGILVGVPCAAATKTLLRGIRTATPGAISGH